MDQRKIEWKMKKTIRFKGWRERPSGPVGTHEGATLGPILYIIRTYTDNYIQLPLALSTRWLIVFCCLVVQATHKTDHVVVSVQRQQPAP